MHRALRLATLMAALVTLVACSAETTDEAAAIDGSEAPLMDLDELLEGAPDPLSLPDEPKADQVFPKQFDLVEFQSPVKSQGGRGVCSIFSTVALMEHLYIKAGWAQAGLGDMPDFSEQFLQWSVKFEVGAFRNTGGSNANRNLEAIRRFGIVDEATYPYESSPWGTINDERCTGDDQPTVCFTNGEPPDEIKNAHRYMLPSSRWVSSRPNSIKAVLMSKKQGVIAGGQFFYQSWNHRKSALPTNAEYFAEGYVLAPNQKDIEVSSEKRAGHSFLLVGWDDDLSVPTVDAEGNQVVDADGNPVMETGFFLFKNSWGTDKFGRSNDFGRGYGWISMAYIQKHLSIYTAEAPRLTQPEICGDGLDNDDNGAVDCDDNACAEESACQPDDEICDDGLDNDENGAIDCADPVCAEADACAGETPGSLSGAVRDGSSIPDVNADGIESVIRITGEGALKTVTVSVEITHTYRGDLGVTLVHPSGASVVLHDHEGRNAEDLYATFTPDDFVGLEAAGAWTLKVTDDAAGDTGTLDGWSLELTVAE